jgi:hypothetical protein
VEFMLMQLERLHLRLLDDHSGRISRAVQLGLDAQSSDRTRMADELDHGLEGSQRLAPPVLRDVAEQPVLDLVPLCAAET